MSDNKKTLVLSIVGVLVLVLVVVGVSYAMYTFTGTGTTENVITTGSISVELDPTTSPDSEVTIDKQTITLNNQYPMTDVEGTQSSEVLRFYVSATLSGSTTINYEIGMDKDASSTLEDSEVKINLSKRAGAADATWLYGTVNTGELVSTRIAAARGTLTDTTITSYLLDKGSFTQTGIITYEMKMWVDENYNLPTTDTSEGNEHSNATTSESYSFKIKAYATQAA